jgi:hypothetical protein
MSKLVLLSTSNTKTEKGEKKGYLTFVLNLAPSDMSGFNTCPMASVGCRGACLNTSGNGNYPAVQAARVRKTQMFFNNRDAFMCQLFADIAVAKEIAVKENLTPCFRLNTTSDIRWENMPINGHKNIMLAYPTDIFYDYTKIPNRKGLPDNYTLTFSRSESNETDVKRIIKTTDTNVAVVFATKKGKDLPDKWMGRKVVDGDETDLRFLDPKGVIVGLRAKGKAQGKEWGGFVVTP